MEAKNESRTKMIGGVLIVWVIAIALYYGMNALEPTLTANPHLFGFAEWITGAAAEPGWKVLWAIGDFTEGTVHKSLLGSIGLVGFGFIAHWINKTKPEVKIYGISFNTGNFPWVVIAATSGLLISAFLYGRYLGTLGWLPTFLPGCTIPAALVTMYGGGWKTSLTSGVLSGIVQFPLAYVGMILAVKMGMPSLVLVTVFGMTAGGFIITEVFRLLPWTRAIVFGKVAPSFPGYGENRAAIPVEPTMGWVFRRTVTDPTEVFFFGSEIAGIGLLIGSMLSWFLNPLHNVYGIPHLFTAVLAAQLMGCSLCALVYYKKWKDFAWYPTYTVPISVGVILLQFGTALPLILVSVLLCTFIIPPIAWKFMCFVTSKMPRYPGMCGSVSGMGVGIAICVLIIKGLLLAGVPLL